MNEYRPHYGYYVCIVVLLQLVTGAWGKDEYGYYLVTASRNLYPNQPYGFGVGVFNSRKGLSVLISVTGPNLNKSIEMRFNPHQPHNWFSFNIPKLKQGDYYLNIAGLYGVHISNSIKLISTHSKTRVQIQTPKSNYGPGQLLQFRVFFHNELMMDVSPERDAHIWIEDSKGHIVKSYKDFKVTKGSFQSELHLSNLLNLGRWRICVENGPGDMERCTFIKISNYELTTFKVALSSPSRIQINKKSIVIRVKAHYTNGTPLEGKQVVYLEANITSVTPPRSIKIGLKKPLQNGQSESKIYLSNFAAELANKPSIQLLLTSIVYEQLTDKMVITTKPITLTADNSLNPNRKRMKRTFKKTSNIVPSNYGTPKGKTVRIEFKVDQQLEEAICVVMCNSHVLAAEHVYPETPKIFAISIELTDKMGSWIYAMIYSMRQRSSTLLVGVKAIYINNLLNRRHQHVNLEAPIMVTTGEMMTLSFNATKGSYVGLSSLDERTVTFNDWVNDFTDEYSDILPSGPSFGRHNDPRSMKLSPAQLGLITLTNAPRISDIMTTQTKVNARSMNWQESELNQNFDYYQTAESSQPVNAVNMQSACNRYDQFKISDVWIFDHVLARRTGYSDFSARAPNVITNWRISVFTVEPKAGLILMPKPYIVVESLKPVLVDITVPHHINIGEILKISVNCFNRRGKKTTVTINFTHNGTKIDLINYPQNQNLAFSAAKKVLVLGKHSSNYAHYYIRSVDAGTLNLDFTVETFMGTEHQMRYIKVIENRPDFQQHTAIYLSQQESGSLKKYQIDVDRSQFSKHVKCFCTSNVMAAALHRLSKVEPMDNGDQIISKIRSFYNMWSYFGQINTNVGNNLKHCLEDQLKYSFQSLLRFRVPDEGFSYNLKREADCSSTWVTAYALRMFQLLDDDLFPVDNHLMTKCEDFLLSRRQDNVTFVESCETPGRRSLNPLELTIEVHDVLKRSKRSLDLKSTLNWINRKMESETDINLMAKSASEMPKWTKPTQGSENWKAHRRDLETAGHILMQQAKSKRRPQPELALWIISHLHGSDRAVNCYERSVAELAFFEYIKVKQKSVAQLNLTASADDNKTTNLLQFNKNRPQKMQHLKFTLQSDKILFQAKGTGDLLISCTLDPKVTNITNLHYKLDVKQKFDLLLDNDLIKLEICVKRNKKDRKYYVGSELKLRLPSGYQFAAKSINKLLNENLVRQASTSSLNTKLFVTLKALEADKAMCLFVITKSFHRLEKLQNGILSAYDTNSVKIVEHLKYNITLAKSVV